MRNSYFHFSSCCDIKIALAYNDKLKIKHITKRRKNNKNVFVVSTCIKNSVLMLLSQSINCYLITDGHVSITTHKVLNSILFIANSCEVYRLFL